MTIMVPRIHDGMKPVTLRPLKKFKPLVVDFETYWGPKYSLRMMSTSDYVRGDQFKIHCVGAKLGNAKTRIFTDMKKFAAWLAKVQAEYEIELIGHNLYFDGLILSEFFGFVPAAYRCTMSMSKGLFRNTTAHGLDTVAKLFGLKGKVKAQANVNTFGKRDLTRQELTDLGLYCVDDCEDTYSIYQAMRPYIPDDEMDIIHDTVRCFCDPVLRVNGPMLEEAIAEVEAKRAVLYKQAIELVNTLAPGLVNAKRPFETVLRSAVDFPLLLEALGVEVPMKQNDKGLWIPALAKKDTGFVELCEDPDPLVRLLCEARLQFTSNQTVTRAQRLLDATQDGALLPVMYGYCGALSMRWTAGNKMNLQNLQRGSALRRAIEAPKGWHIMTGDSAQIEARILAYIAGQWDLVEAFRVGADVYSEFAMEIYPDVEVSKENPDTETERHVGKTSILGLGYGMGFKKFITTMATSFIPVLMEVEDAKHVVNTYRTKYPMIPALWKYLDSILADMAAGNSGFIEFQCGLRLEYEPDRIWMPNGLCLHYPELREEYDEDTGRKNGYTYSIVRGKNVSRKKIYGGLLTENIVQCLARIVVGDQMRLMAKAYRVVMTTHDEVSMLVRATKTALAKATKFMVKTMSTAPWWAPDLPVATEVKDAPYYCK